MQERGFDFTSIPESEDMRGLQHENPMDTGSGTEASELERARREIERKISQQFEQAFESGTGSFDTGLSTGTNFPQSTFAAEELKEAAKQMERALSDSDRMTDWMKNYQNQDESWRDEMDSEASWRERFERKMGGRSKEQGPPKEKEKEEHIFVGGSMNGVKMPIDGDVHVGMTYVASEGEVSIEYETEYQLDENGKLVEKEVEIEVMSQEIYQYVQFKIKIKDETYVSISCFASDEYDIYSDQDSRKLVQDYEHAMVQNALDM